MEIHNNREVNHARENEKPSAAVRRETEFATLLNRLSEKKATPKEEREERIERAISDASQRHGLDGNLVKAVVKQESNFNPVAESHCGAKGLMQLMPATAKDLGVSDRCNIEDNVDGGCRYLKQMLVQFDGDIEKALAAYNAGPGAVKKYGGIPPYPETQKYVVSILSHYQKFSGGAPLPAMSVTVETQVAMKPSPSPKIDQQLIASAMISNAIASTPMSLPSPERNKKEDPPPPPPPPSSARFV
jgi:hypothetical protein